MNPFTRFLNQWSRNRPLTEFIAHWDRLEQLTIQVYREQLPLTDLTEVEFAEVWSWLQAHYGEWAEALRPYWQQTQAAGEPVKTDPFQLLIDIESPAAILGNWTAMQHLPAAREALNLFLGDQAG